MRLNKRVGKSNFYSKHLYYHKRPLTVHQHSCSHNYVIISCISDMFALYIIITALALLWLLFKKDALKSIPGPSTIPFLGNLHQLVPMKLHLQLLEWGQVHGSVYKLVLAGSPVVVVTGIRAMHEVKYMYWLDHQLLLLLVSGLCMR